MKRLTFLLVLATACSAFSQTAKYSNEFLNIGVDAAAFGMANAVTATTRDVNSGYWNPAGLVHLEDNQVSAMHANYFANIATYNYVAGAMPIDSKSAVGFSVIRFGVDDILNTTQLIDEQGNIDYNRISLFSTADYAFTLSYARNLPLEGFSYGVNTKVIRRVIGDFANAWGFGFDAGIQFQKKSWYFGVMARDITTTYNTWTFDDDELATIQNAIDGQNQAAPEASEITLPKLQIGVAKTTTIRRDFDLTTSLNLDMRFAQTNDIISSGAMSATPAFGFEVGYINLVYLRGGVGNFQNLEQLGGQGTEIGFQPNFGVGFKYKGIQIDYALTDIGDQSLALYSNVFSLKLDWSVFR
ncbi:putative type IX sorting system protein PorV2 [Psychroflexus montanilacus]|uniref:putative type IX sorting system protein PorV2 n=1 Tax=Psychroflexus montanilacus TaxID=2873598 RepID=UPI001CC998AE|nr:PorV/PorQ family protein [Psychroflexus montanilacus]MBZ9651808.1 PorV/PorQ family protein [Psychroflexus montanilacus]